MHPGLGFGQVILVVSKRGALVDERVARWYGRML